MHTNSTYTTTTLNTMNLAHIKCLSMLLGALCTMQTVCLSKLAAAFDNRASSESSFRRIHRFLAQKSPGRRRCPGTGAKLA